MTSDERWFPSHLKELGDTECPRTPGPPPSRTGGVLRRPRASRAAGDYALDQSTILIQTSPHSTLASRLRTAPTSFQIDEYTQTGWSVLVRGSAAYVDPTDLPADEDRPHTWAE